VIGMDVSVSVIPGLETVTMPTPDVLCLYSVPVHALDVAEEAISDFTHGSWPGVRHHRNRSSPCGSTTAAPGRKRAVD
jgi:hypothetical protein